MDLRARLEQDMKAALKSGQKERLSVIRMLLSDVKNIDLDPKKPTAEQAVAAYAKKLRKSLEEYERLGKAEEIKNLKFEIGVAEEYLPKKASAEETARLVDEFLAKNTFTEKQLGQAMGAFMKAHGSSVDAAACVALKDRRLAAYITSLLRSLEFQILAPAWSGETPARLLVLDGVDGRRGELEQFLRADMQRRALVLGEGTKPDDHPQVVWLDGRPSPAQIREALQQTLGALEEMTA